MTAATREPEDEELDAVRWNDRALFGSFRGLPWWAAVLITFVLAIVGTYIDVTTSTAKSVGWVFAITFFVGAVGAVVFVERRSMFGPVVQPPLVLAIVVPLIVVFTSGVPSGGLAAIGLGLGKPLIDGFPAMAITTLCTVLIGILRVSTQKDPNRLTKEEKRELKRRDPAEDRPKRREPAPTSAPDEDRPRRKKPAATSDEPRPKRPRPAGEGRPATDRPRRPRDPSKGDRPAQRKPRPRTDD
ncbi:DUF6542 domain-containing protein [Saccharothrix sp. NPDC042600]|uniref:DUF6542 domain-containing protein n=1 Tax=Saccharothrix TaxID=2071 RepID=UPI0033D3F0A9|nr:hypothetical protein GCM10017745_86740 [Saccharothrix mutabilis subsp. capreolus]